MTDLEMTRLCAQAMGQYEFFANTPGLYDPLHDDAQAMALVKKILLTVMWNWVSGDAENPVFEWCAEDCSGFYQSHGSDLNRAIVECVAKMQASKK